MEQLKIARHNAELGHYGIALTAYKAALDSKILTANVSLKITNFTFLLFQERLMTEKEMQTLKTLVNELNQIKIKATPETPTDPMVWNAPPERPLPAKKTPHRSTANIHHRPPPSNRKSTTNTTQSRKTNAAAASSNKSTPVKPIRRTTSQSALDNNAIEPTPETTTDLETNEDKVFDSSAYERELVDTIERTVIQRNLNVHWQGKNRLKTLTQLFL